MDPNAALAEMRELAHDLLNGTDTFTTSAYEIAEHVQALDEWLSKGGFLPNAWVHVR
jgi:hypothetical protein